MAAENAAATPSRSNEAPLRALPRGFLVHVALLVVSIVVAIALWTRAKEPKALVAGDVTVWSGRAADVSSIHYETKTKKIALDSKKDDAGRYFLGTIEKEAAAQSDAGAKSDKPESVTFVSIASGEKVAEAFAPLKALRALGKIGDDRAAEFGLADPEGTLTVGVSGASHKLLVGAATPGGSDRYVKDAATGEVYAIKGDGIRDLDAAETRLLEHDLHEWRDPDVARVAVTAGGKKREVVRSGPEGKRFWADAASPDQNDETLGNWMTKVEKLRPSDYVSDVAGKTDVVRLDYEGPGKKKLGFVELVKAPGANGKTDYFVTSERTRLYAKVASTAGDQVEQDLGTIVK